MNIDYFKQAIKLIFRIHPSTDLQRRMKIIKNNKIDIILDVGANVGLYHSICRKNGYKGLILCFEPVLSAFNILESNIMIDKMAHCFNTALGSFDGETTINVSNNLESSSILQMEERHLTAEKNSIYLDIQICKITTLDIFIKNYPILSSNIMLKIDAQGYEMEVLKGTINSMHQLKIIQLEMSLVSLYKGEVLFLEMCQFIYSLGFRLFSLENGFSDSLTGQLMQVDGIFVRESDCNNA